MPDSPDYRNDAPPQVLALVTAAHRVTRMTRLDASIVLHDLADAGWELTDANHAAASFRAGWKDGEAHVINNIWEYVGILYPWTGIGLVRRAWGWVRSYPQRRRAWKQQVEDLKDADLEWFVREVGKSERDA